MADYRAAAEILNKITFGFNAFSLIGSPLSIIVFSRKAFKKSSFGFYSKWLSIFDLLGIFNFAFGLASTILNSTFTNNYDWACKFYYYIICTTSSLPTLFLLIFSLDQLIIVSRTERFQFFKKRWFQYSVISAIIIFQSSIFSPVIFLSKVQTMESQNITFSICDVYSGILPFVFLFEAKLVPFTFIVISMFFIVRILIKSRKKLFTNHNAIRPRDVKFAYNLVIINIISFVLTIPAVVYFMLPDGYFIWSGLFNAICFFLFYLNYALNFWINFIFNSIFRNEFFILFRIINPINGRFTSRTNPVNPNLDNYIQ